MYIFRERAGHDENFTTAPDAELQEQNIDYRVKRLLRIEAEAERLAAIDEQRREEAKIARQAKMLDAAEKIL